MKYNFLLRTPTDVRVLIRLINEVLNVDILDKTREREHVNARIIFSSILRERGYSLTKIGSFLGKDHSSIVHYLKNVDWYLKTDKTFASNYGLITSNYYEGYDPVYEMSCDEIKKEYILLKNKFNSLSLELEGLKSDQQKSKAQEERLSPLYRMITERTLKGSENFIERKLNHFFNGVYDE